MSRDGGRFLTHIQNANTGWGSQHNYNAPGQTIYHGRDRIINPRKILWEAIAGVGASHDAEKQSVVGECLDGTRVEVLRIINGWIGALDDGGTPICWLAGALGVGKTSIALTIAKGAREKDDLAASFFFLRSDPKRNNPSALMLTIAHGLATASPSIGEEIDDRIAADPTILEARLETQFEELVRQPIMKRCARVDGEGHSFAFDGPRLVIIDGLDECGDDTTQERILSILVSAHQQHPSFPLQFLICSRTESWLQTAFDSQPLVNHTKPILLDDTFHPLADIERYYIHEFAEIRGDRKYAGVPFPNPWPSADDRRVLVQRSDGQFVYAVTLVKFVRASGSYPPRQLGVILDVISTRRPHLPPSQTPFYKLDRLYDVILSANYNYDAVRLILAAILILPSYIKYGSSPECVELLLGLSRGEVLPTLSAMYSVLEIRGWEDEIRVYHNSFTEYLFDSSRSGEFHVDGLAQHELLARRWLRALSTQEFQNYSFDQIRKSRTSQLFTQWIPFCVLIEEPTQELVDSLWKVDINTLFLYSQEGSDNRSPRAPQRRKYCPKWNVIFENLASWLQSRTVEVDPKLIERFRQKPRRFHLQLTSDLALDNDIVRWGILNTVACEYDCSLTRGADTACREFSATGPPLPLWLVSCDCADPTSPETSHRTYQAACLQTVRSFVSDFCSTTSRKDLHIAAIDELNGIFGNITDSSLLPSCAFTPELLSLLRAFFSFSMKNRDSLEMPPTTSKDCRTELLKWIEICPDRYAYEAGVLKAQIVEIFSEEGSFGNRRSIAYQGSLNN